MSVRSVRQLFSFVSLLIILSLLLPANHLPASAQQPPVGPAAAVPNPAAVSQALGAGPVMFNKTAGQPGAAAPDAEITSVLAVAMKIAAGESHTCALTTDGRVQCWGRNDSGQLGDGTTTSPRPTPVAVSGLASGVTDIAAGTSHTCALTTDGGVKCWGANSYGQLGVTPSPNQSVPLDVEELTSGVQAIAAGASHTCALTTGGGVKCWGGNGYGQLGDALTTDRAIPMDVSGLKSGVIDIAAGENHTCALTTGGGVKCWGANSDGQLGVAPYSYFASPVDVSELATGVTDIVTGNRHTCALMDAVLGGGVKCWGYNDDGQLGVEPSSGRHTPADVNGLTSGVLEIFAGHWHTCAAMDGAQGGFKCWGYNASGQLGDGTTTNRATPVAVSGLDRRVQAIAAGGYHTCALTDVIQGRRVQCWGYNNHGQLGNGMTTNQAVPVKVSELASGVTDIVARGGHTCALTNVVVTAGGGVQCWGNNRYGQLGDGETTNRAYPWAVSGLTSGAIAITAGDFHTCVLTLNGGVKCWGDNRYGQLGNHSTANSNIPVDVQGLARGVFAIAAGGFHTCALMEEAQGGGVKCWGANQSGQLGNNSTTNSNVPVDVLGLTSAAREITAGGAHTCARMDGVAGGGVKCWGDNRAGQVGDGTIWNIRKVPVDVSGLASGVRAIAAGDYHTCARMDTTQGGGVKCWGASGDGWVGGQWTRWSPSPVDVDGLAGEALYIAAGGRHTCALTTGGGVQCWGANRSGQLGDGTTTDRSAFVGVTGLASEVSDIAAGGFHTCALTIDGGVKCWGDNGRGQLGVDPGWTPVDVHGSYTLSGRVTGKDGNAIAGVTISGVGGVVGSATTSASGVYTISWLTAGTYTITPSKSGCSFSPASLTVTVPPDATGQDFASPYCAGVQVQIESPMPHDRYYYGGTVDVRARVTQQGAPLLYARVQARIQLGITGSPHVTWLNDLGLEGDVTPYDGIYSAQLTMPGPPLVSAGNYYLDVIASREGEGASSEGSSSTVFTVLGEALGSPTVTPDLVCPRGTDPSGAKIIVRGDTCTFNATVSYFGDRSIQGKQTVLTVRAPNNRQTSVRLAYIII